MKKIISLLLAISVLFAIGACKGKNNPPTSDSASNDEFKVESGYMQYTVDEPTEFEVGGYGAQMDTDMFMPWNKLSEEEEKMIADRVKDMNLQYTRIKMFPEFFERANDNDDPNSFDYAAEGVDFNSVEMQALYKVLDICEENHIRVDLCWYNCNATFSSYDGKYTGTWLGYTVEETGAWATAPRMTDDFNGYEETAENMSACFNYLINEKGYTCLYAYCYIAEGFYSADKSIHWDNYLDCMRVIDQRMKADGWDDKLISIGVANETTRARYFDELVEPVKDMYDCYGLGSYFWDMDTDLDAIRAYYEDWTAVAEKYGKFFIISEFGTSNKHMLDAVTWDDIDSYEAGLYHALYMIMSSKYGVTHLDKYILGDTFFTNSYVHRLGLWQYRSEGWKAHPSYYFWGMVCKYSDIGAKIYNVEEPNDDVVMTALQLPDGKWSYMIVNRTEQSKKIAVINRRSDRAGEMSVYRMTESLIPENRECVLPEAYTTVDASTGVVYLTLPAMSFTVASNK